MRPLCPAVQRRQEQRKRLNLERYETASESSDDDAGAGGAAAAKPRSEVLAVYDSGGVTTTVTTIAMHSDRCYAAGPHRKPSLPSNGSCTEVIIVMTHSARFNHGCRSRFANVCACVQ